MQTLALTWQGLSHFLTGIKKGRLSDLFIKSINYASIVAMTTMDGGNVEHAGRNVRPTPAPTVRP